MSEQPSSNGTEPQQKRGLAIAGLVLGIVGVCLSWMPVVNNVAAVVGVVAIVLAAVAFHKARKSGGRKGMPIAGLVLGIVAVVIVFATQAMYGAAIDEASKALNASAPAAQTDAKSGQPAAENQNLKVGESLVLNNGLEIKLDSVEYGVTGTYGTDPNTKVVLTLTNTSDKEVDYGEANFLGEGASGSQDHPTIVVGADEPLGNLKKLAPKGSVTGPVYFKGEIKKLRYSAYAGMGESSASWTLS